MNTTPLFYESLRNRYNLSKVLRKNDCIYDNIDDVYWKLTEDGSEYGIAKCECIFSQNKKFRIGQVKLKSFYDEFEKLDSKYNRIINYE